MNKIKLLIVDDSAVIRSILTSNLKKFNDIEVTGAARDPYEARDMIVKLKPDVITLDIEMPRMNGLEFISVLMEHYPLPIIVISSVVKGKCDTSLKALELGAVDVFAKPSIDISGKLPLMISKLHEIIVASAKAKVFKKTAGRELKRITSLSQINATNKVIAIGASTGGTEALKRVLIQFPENIPPIIISQHMPPGFTKSFADRLDQLCEKLEVREAKNGDILYPGLALIAPGDFHMLLKQKGASYCVIVKGGPRVCRQRPSVDVMFTSAAKEAGKNAIGVLLTGMGADGAEGLLKMKYAGSKTIAQSEKTCVVYGMPGEAVNKGAVDYIEDLDLIPKKVVSILKN